MIERLRARPEWKFFGILVRADRTLAVSWSAVLAAKWTGTLRTQRLVAHPA
jgi:hypothetical protein